jgi:hypothetical protein
MWTTEHTVETSAAAETVHGLYADVAAWPTWDASVELAELDGPFVAGTSGRLRPAGIETLPFTLVSVEPGRGFTDETPFMGHVLRFIHLLEPLAGGGTRITHRVEIDGPAAADMGPNVASDLPEAMAALAAAAERVAAAA